MQKLPKAQKDFERFIFNEQKEKQVNRSTFVNEHCFRKLGKVQDAIKNESVIILFIVFIAAIFSSATKADGKSLELRKPNFSHFT